MGAAENCMGLSLVNMLDGPISLLVFDHNLFRQLSYHISWHKIRASGQSSGLLWKNSHIILPVFPSNNADSFFYIMKETQREQCPCDRNKSPLSLLGLVMCFFFGVGDADACFGHKPVLTSTGFHSHFCFTEHLTWCYCVAAATFFHSCGRMKTWLCEHCHCFTSEAICASAAHKMKPHMCHNAWLLIYCVLPTQINICVAILGTCYTLCIGFWRVENVNWVKHSDVNYLSLVRLHLQVVL